MSNPVIAEVTRGSIVESRHRGAFAVVNHSGQLVAGAGDNRAATFPRSAIKAFQCLPLIESGAAAHFGLNDEEIALCCSSHSGEKEHVRVARAILAKAGVDEACYECGAHMPTAREACYDLVRHSEKPQQVHNNCSGKHAGMLALARHLGAPLEGYVKPDHPVQRAVAECLGRYCDADLATAPMGTDGCSVPTWALPLDKVALGFARLTDQGNAAAQWIIRAARAHPFLIAGTGRFDTRAMQAVPRLFIKGGAEGVFCGCIPHAGLGFALKCDDGAGRGAEVAGAHMLAALDVWALQEREALLALATEHLHNWRKINVGEIHAAAF
ncbi:MAG: asparaginase [Alphaproteobacteria bacterium]|nr:asparaginase [Alphaproteobacteria bacterium]